MRGVILALALLFVAFLLAVVIATKASATPAATCRFQHLDPGTWTQHEENVTALCVQEQWPVPGGLSKLRAVIQCESGWNRLAYNPAGYVGLAQHALSSWASRVRIYSPRWWDLNPRWQNSRTALVVTVRMVRALGWSPWTCAG